MSETFQCGDNSALVGYLYDECDPAERAAIDAHLAVCAACAAELAALGSTRLQLRAWTPPEAELGFQIVRPHASTAARPALDDVEEQASRPGPQLRPVGRPVPGPAPWFRQPLPAWAQAAAACLIFAAGLWLGVARGNAPALQPGASRSDAPAVAAVAPEAAAATPVSVADLAALERRLRGEIAQMRSADATTMAAASPTASDAQLLSRVRDLIAESEQRQQRELALRTRQVLQDVDSQRQLDLAQIQRSFGQMEGLTGAQVREQRDMLNYLMRVSQQQGR
jgi:anti-sigma factor RsiW